MRPEMENPAAGGTPRRAIKQQTSKDNQRYTPLWPASQAERDNVEYRVANAFAEWGVSIIELGDDDVENASRWGWPTCARDCFLPHTPDYPPFMTILPKWPAIALACTAVIEIEERAVEEMRRLVRKHGLPPNVPVIEALRRLPLDLLQEAQPFDMRVARFGAGDQLSFKIIERRE